MLDSTVDRAQFSFNNGWKAFSIAVLKKLRIHPNQLWLSHDGKVGALVATKGERWDEYALSQVGLDYLFTAINEKRIEQGIVVLAGFNGEQTVVAEQGLAGVLLSIAKVPPRSGPWGPYFWMNHDLTPFVDRELF